MGDQAILMDPVSMEGTGSSLASAWNNLVPSEVPQPFLLSNESSEEEGWLNWVRKAYKPGVYDSLVKSSESDESLRRTIRKDVPRSFGGREASQEQYDALEEVLLAFSKYEYGEGYTQGMGFIAAFALDQQQTYDRRARENAFWLMVEASDRLPNGFFYRVAQDEVLVFEAIVTKYLSELRMHMEGDLFAALCYLIPRWFLSLFVFCMPDSVTARLWNEVLFVDDAVHVSERCDNKLSNDDSMDRHFSNEYKFILAYRLHCVALALLTLHAPVVIKQSSTIHQALERISKAQMGSATEAELLNLRDSRAGFEFMQIIAEAIQEDKYNASRIINMARTSPLTLSEFRNIRADTVAYLVKLRRQVRLVIRIQRWYRSIKVRSKARSSAPIHQMLSFEASCFACFGNDRNVETTETFCIQQ